MSEQITDDMRLKVFQDAIRELTERKDKPSGVWKPEMGDEIWTMGEFGPKTLTWSDDEPYPLGYAIDIFSPTAEACQHAHDKRCAQVKYERLGKQAWLDEGKVCDWSDGMQDKYYNTCNSSRWLTEIKKYEKLVGAICFPSAKSATAAREAMGADMDLLL